MKIKKRKTDKGLLSILSRENEDLSQKQYKHLGKLGLSIMISGLVILYYDAFRINQMFPVNYRFYEHPEIHIPIIGIVIAFVGTFVFIFNFAKGRKVI